MPNAVNALKNAFTWTVVVTTIAWSVGAAALITPSIANAQSECPELAAGDLFKVADNSAVYILNGNMERMYFPNSEVYKTWFEDFSGVVVIPNTCVDNYPAPSVAPFGVNFRPGSRMVKVQISPSVYVIEPMNMKSKIGSEAVASELYGSSWATLVRDIPDVFWPNYAMTGSQITDAMIHDGMLVKKSGDATVYYAMDGMLHEVDGTLPAPMAGDVRVVADSLVDGMTMSSDSVTPASILSNPPQTDGSYTGPVTPPPATGGDVTVSLSAATPAATTVPQGASHVPFLSVNFTAGNQDTVIETVELERVGLGDDADFDEVWASVGGVAVSNEQSVNSDQTVLLTLNMNLAANNTVTVDFLAAMAAAADTGNLNAFRIPSSDKVEVNGGNVLGSFPVRGNQMGNSAFEIGEVAMDDRGSNDEVEVGSEEEVIGEFELDWTSNNEADGFFKSIRLKVEGSADVGDLGPIYLFEDGDMVSNQAQVWNDYITFLIDGDKQQTEDGETRRFEVKADIVSGENDETFILELKDNRDLFFVDGDAEFGAKVDSSGLPSSRLKTYTIDAGQFSVSLDESNPSNEEYAKNTSDIDALVAELDLGQKATVEGLTIYLDADTTFAVDGGTDTANVNLDIDRVELFVNDKKIGTETSVTRDTGVGAADDNAVTADEFYWEFDNTFTLEDNDLVRVVVDLENDARANKYKFTFGATDFDSPEYFTSGDSIDAGDISGTATGNFLEIADASVSVTRNDGYSASETFVSGAENVCLFRFLVDAGTASPIKLRTLAFDSSLSGAEADRFSNFRLVATGESSEFTDIEDPSGTDGTFSFTGINRSIDSNGQLEACLFGDIDTGASATTTLTFDLLGSADDSVIEDAEGDDITFAGASSAGLDIVDSGVLTVDVDGNTPDEDLVVANGGNTMDLGIFKFTAEDDDVWVSDFYVANNASTGGDAVDTNADFLLSNVQLVVDGVVLKQKALSGGKVHFTLSGSNRVFVEKNENVRVTFRGVFNDVTDADESGESLALALYGVEAQTAGSGQDLAMNTGVTTTAGQVVSTTDDTTALDSAPTGETMTAHATRPTLSALGLSTTEITNATMDVFKFRVGADVGEDVTWAAVTLSVTGDCDGGANVVDCFTGVRLKDSSGNEIETNLVTSTGFIQLFISSSSPNDLETITAGEAKDYRVEADLTGFIDGDAISIRIVDGLAAPAAGDNLLGASGAFGTTAPFLWSDNSGASEQGDDHWFTGSNVPGLDTDSVTVSKS